MVGEAVQSKPRSGLNVRRPGISVHSIERRWAWHQDRAPFVRAGAGKASNSRSAPVFEIAGASRSRFVEVIGRRDPCEESPVASAGATAVCGSLALAVRPDAGHGRCNKLGGPRVADRSTCLPVDDERPRPSIASLPTPPATFSSSAWTRRYSRSPPRGPMMGMLLAGAAMPTGQQLKSSRCRDVLSLDDQRQNLPAGRTSIDIASCVPTDNAMRTGVIRLLEPPLRSGVGTAAWPADGSPARMRPRSRIARFELPLA